MVPGVTSNGFAKMLFAPYQTNRPSDKADINSTTGKKIE